MIFDCIGLSPVHFPSRRGGVVHEVRRGGGGGGAGPTRDRNPSPQPSPNGRGSAVPLPLQLNLISSRSNEKRQRASAAAVLSRIDLHFIGHLSWKRSWLFSTM